MTDFITVKEKVKEEEVTLDKKDSKTELGRLEVKEQSKTEVRERSKGKVENR